MTRVIDLLTATGSDLDEFGRALDIERLGDPLECDSHYRKRLIDENEQRKLKRTPMSDMTLRDYFAAKAMQGMLANGDWVTNMVNATGQEADEVVGIAAYEIADAMLRERAK